MPEHALMGLSPHIRGKAILVTAYAVRLGSIPAHTEEGEISWRTIQKDRVYPRTYGEGLVFNPIKYLSICK